MIEDDVKAFDAVMGAYGMAKETDADKASRDKAIQAALKQATDVPLHCCHAAREVIDLALKAAEKGNLNVISDAGVARARRLCCTAKRRVECLHQRKNDNGQDHSPRLSWRNWRRSLLERKDQPKRLMASSRVS